MKKRTLKLVVSAGLVAVLVLGALVLFSCAGGGFEPAAIVEEEQEPGNLNIFIPAAAPWILEALGMEWAQSKGFAYIEEVHYTITDDADLTVYEDTVAAQWSSETGGFYGAYLDVYIDPGIGYNIAVEIFNYHEDADDPVVTGTTVGTEDEDFAIVAGELTNVRITCEPNPDLVTTLNPDTTYSELTVVSAEADWLAEPAVMTEIGGEKWYKITPVSDFTTFTVTPDEDSVVMIMLYEADGTQSHIEEEENWISAMAASFPLGEGGAAEPPMDYKGVAAELIHPIIADTGWPTTPGETYYLLVVGFNDPDPLLEDVTFDVEYSASDDLLEDNDTWEEVDVQHEIAEGEANGLFATSMPGDEDWFKFTMPTDGDVTIACSYNTDGPLEMHLWRYDDGEMIVYEMGEPSTHDPEYDWIIEEAWNGDYYIQVLSAEYPIYYKLYWMQGNFLPGGKSAVRIEFE